jgi:hypothetical protein
LRIDCCVAADRHGALIRATIFVMETQSAPRVISVDRFRRGVVIAFDDGKCALYSSDLLHGTFPQAEELEETDWNLIE